MKVTVEPYPTELQLAASPHTPPTILRQIANSKDLELRRLVASNPNAPTDVLWSLGIDFPEVVLANPIFELLQLEQLQLVTEIPHATLTSLLQCERVPKKFMEYALTQQDYSLWLAVAYNPHTPSALIENLARKSRSQDRELIRAIAAHPHTPDYLLAEIIDIGINVALAVAENPSTPVSILKQILLKYTPTHQRVLTTIVALHPSIDIQLSIEMDVAPDRLSARSLGQAKHSETTAPQLTELAQTDWHTLLLAIARHPQTPTATLDLIWHKIRELDTAQRTLSEGETGTECTHMDRLVYDSFVSNPNISSQLRGELRKLLKW